MFVKNKIYSGDDIDWKIEYCETGSELVAVDKMGGVIIELGCIPPAKLLLLRDRINEEISKGIMVDRITKRRKQ